MLLGMWGPFKSIEYGKIMDFPLLLLSSGLVLSHHWLCRSYFLMFYEVHWCFLPNGEDTAWLFEMQTECFFFFFLFCCLCEQLLWRTQSLMPCEYYAFSKQPCCRITLLCIFIPAIYWDQLWLESQAFISEPPLVFIKTSYARACSIWSF